MTPTGRIRKRVSITIPETKLKKILDRSNKQIGWKVLREGIKKPELLHKQEQLVLTKKKRRHIQALVGRALDIIQVHGKIERAEVQRIYQQLVSLWEKETFPNENATHQHEPVLGRRLFDAKLQLNAVLKSKTGGFLSTFRKVYPKTTEGVQASPHDMDFSPDDVFYLGEIQ